jgi:hypothetical protein
MLALLLLAACTSPPDSIPSSPTAGSPGPLASPRPALTARQTVYVGNTDRLGADFRQAPGAAGARIRTVPDGAVLEATGREQQADERTWSEVRDSTGTVGWVITDYVSSTPPPRPTPTLPPIPDAPTPTPTTIPRIALPTATQPTAGPRPTDTLVPIVPPGQQPALAPIPAVPTARPGLPTLPPLAPARPTNEMIDGDSGTPNIRGATLVPTRGPAGR